MDKIEKTIEFLTLLFEKQKIIYVPTLGLIYKSGNLVEGLLKEVLNNQQTNIFLPYDKDKRWFKSKRKKIIDSLIFINGDDCFIPVENNQGNKNLKIIHYGKNGLNNQKIRGLLDKIQMKEFILCSFEKPIVKESFRVQNVYFKKISKKDRIETDFSKDIKLYSKLDKKTKRSLSLLGKEPTLNGFNFLWKKIINENKLKSEIICVVKDKKIVGAIGPIDILEDFWSNFWLPPPYFGIKKEFRRRGYGSKLWRIALSFAQRIGAKYTLLEAQKESSADWFYKKQSLKSVKKLYLFQIKNQATS